MSEPPCPKLTRLLHWDFMQLYTSTSALKIRSVRRIHLFLRTARLSKPVIVENCLRCGPSQRHAGQGLGELVQYKYHCLQLDEQEHQQAHQTNSTWIRITASKVAYQSCTSPPSCSPLQPA